MSKRQKAIETVIVFALWSVMGEVAWATGVTRDVAEHVLDLALYLSPFNVWEGLGSVFFGFAVVGLVLYWIARLTKKRLPIVSYTMWPVGVLFIWATFGPGHELLILQVAAIIASAYVLERLWRSLWRYNTAQVSTQASA